MTLHFHTYHDGAEVYIDPPTATEIARYRCDSNRAERQRQAFRTRKTRASLRYSLAAILNRMTLTNSTTSILALAGTTLFAHATIYG